MPLCQYLNPRTGEKCDRETTNWIQVGPVHLSVCEGKHAKAMSPGGRNRNELKRAGREYEENVRRRAQMKNGSEVVTTRPHLTWPDRD